VKVRHKSRQAAKPLSRKPQSLRRQLMGDKKTWRKRRGDGLGEHPNEPNLALTARIKKMWAVLLIFWSILPVRTHQTKVFVTSSSTAAVSNSKACTVDSGITMSNVPSEEHNIDSLEPVSRARCTPLSMPKTYLRASFYWQVQCLATRHVARMWRMKEKT
jgi:hypothetical protein